MASGKNLTMKLLVDTVPNKVLYAEAGKEVVDFLFSLLTMPVGTVVKLLSADGMTGSMGNLFCSVESMKDTYLQTTRSKDALLNPIAASSPSKSTLLLPAPAPATVKLFYCCSSGSRCVRYTDLRGVQCPSCHNPMTYLLQYVDPEATKVQPSMGDGIGYVKGVVTYTVMDDLTVTPVSSISSITMLSKFKVKDVSSLVEMTVNLESRKGLEMLRRSLQSKTVLTDVFVARKATSQK